MSEIKKELNYLSKNLKFNLSEDELTKIENEYQAIIDGLNLITEINLEGIETTSFVHSLGASNLREDEWVEYDTEEVFSNCDLLQGNLVVIKNEK